MRDLAPCPRCRRLLRQREVACPFCFAARAVVLAAVLPLSVACQKATPATQDAAPVTATATTTEPSVTAADTATAVPPLPTVSANLTPSAIASVRQAAVGRDGGAGDRGLLAVLGADAGLSGLLGPPDAGGLLLTGPGIGAYGAAPSPGLGGLGPGQVALSVSGAQAPSDARVIASKRAMMRACYTQGLLAKPDMSGKVKLAVHVAAAGAATATVASASGNLSDDVKHCMTRAIAITPFEPGDRAFEVEVTATNK